MATSQVPQVVERFLKDLLGAKKAIKLYPAGNPLAAGWIQRLHRSLEKAQQEGLPSLMRIVGGRFEWDGGHLVTGDPALEAFRFELETRRINEIAIEAGVEPWELRELVECLNLSEQEIAAGGGVPTLLAQRNVAHITLRGFLWDDSDAGVETPGPAGLTRAMLDLLEGLVAEILEALEEEFRELTDDRTRLSTWLLELAQPGDRAEGVFAAIEMLIPMIEKESDRELRYRALAEAVVSQPDPLRATLASAWLLPRAWIPDVLSLLTRFSGDELVQLTSLVPAATLEELRASLEEMPADDWRRARLREALEDVLALKEVPAAPLDPVIPEDDPAVARLRETVREACAPEAVLDHSVTILFQLLGAAEAEAYPVFLVDTLEEAIGEALGRDRLRLALRVLRALNNTDKLRPEWIAEHQRRLQPLHKRLSDRLHVAPLADVLRRSEGPEAIRDATEYLGMLGREAIGEFIGTLAEDADGRSRARMLEVLATLGPAAVPAIRAWLGDSRWVVVRHMVALLARIGDPAALPLIEKVAKHEHVQVRREVARALAALGGKRAMKPLLEYLHDPDGEVRLTATKLLGSLMDAGAVTPLREFLATPTRTVSDLLVKREIIAALGSNGGPEARQVLEAIARRRVWPWQRNQQKVRELAQQTIKTMQPAPTGAGSSSRG